MRAIEWEFPRKPRNQVEDCSWRPVRHTDKKLAPSKHSLVQNGVMKTLWILSCLAVLTILSPSTATAQAQTLTLVASNGIPCSQNFTTNQVLTVNSFIQSYPGTSYEGVAKLSYYSGLKLELQSHPFGLVYDNSTTSSSMAMAAFPNAVFTGVTNILLTSYADPVALTVTISTPAPQSFVPANAVVIPSDAKGPVQIVLESSSDLLNWTSALPGTYGNTFSNRFFRVRAIAQ